MSKVEKAVVKTIAFYNLLNRPLNLQEINSYLYQLKASKLQVLMAVNRLITKEIIEERNNLYFLTKNSKIVSEYINNTNNKKYWSKVNWVIKILKYIPFLKNVSIINSLSYNGANQNSDIDILIVAKKKRFWTTRALVIFLLELIGQNKNKWYSAGKFCLGFGFDESKLNLSGIKYKKDIDFTYWLANLTPVYDRGIYKNLMNENIWIKNELPNWEEKYVKQEGLKLKFLEKVLSGKFGDSLEKYLAKMQIKRIWNDPKNHRKGASVIADESMMKLHPYDKRTARQREFEVLTKMIIEIR